jgi:hypothetical protein
MIDADERSETNPMRGRVSEVLEDRVAVRAGSSETRVAPVSPDFPCSAAHWMPARSYLSRERVATESSIQL